MVFFSSLSHCCCHDVPCGNDCAQNFSVEEIGVFQACLVENPSVQVVCFEKPRRKEILSCSLCVSRSVGRTGALSAQLRSVGAVAPERVVPSFGFLLVYMRASVEHSSWLMRPHSSHLIQTSHIHCTHLQQGYKPNLCLYW